MFAVRTAGASLDKEPLKDCSLYDKYLGTLKTGENPHTIFHPFQSKLRIQFSSHCSYSFSPRKEDLDNIGSKNL